MDANRVDCDQEGCDYFVVFQILNPDAVPRLTPEPLPRGIGRGEKAGGSTLTVTSAPDTPRFGRSGSPERPRDKSAPVRRNGVASSRRSARPCHRAREQREEVPKGISSGAGDGVGTSSPRRRLEGDKGEYVTPWNDELTLAVSTRESKWNKFGASRFDVIPTVYMIEKVSRRVRWIWKPIHEQDGAWRFESDEAIEGLGLRMTDAVLRSAVPLALDGFGPPLNESLAGWAEQTSPNTPGLSARDTQCTEIDAVSPYAGSGGGFGDPPDSDVEANQSLPNEVPTPGTPPAFTTVAPGCCALRSSRERLAAVSGRNS